LLGIERLPSGKSWGRCSPFVSKPALFSAEGRSCLKDLGHLRLPAMKSGVRNGSQVSRWENPPFPPSGEAKSLSTASRQDERKRVSRRKISWAGFLPGASSLRATLLLPPSPGGDAQERRVFSDGETGRPGKLPIRRSPLSVLPFPGGESGIISPEGYRALDPEGKKQRLFEDPGSGFLNQGKKVGKSAGKIGGRHLGGGLAAGFPRP